VRWARAPGFDAYWYYRDEFFDSIVRPPGARTLERYAVAFEQAGLLIETMREPRPAADAERYERWRRLPLFLGVRAVEPR
jgi:hypothetical protein